MPCRIDASRKNRVILHAYLLDGSIVGYDGTTHVMTGVELHSVRIVLLVVMAVDTLSLSTFRTEQIIIDDALVIVFQTALIDGQLLIGHIRGRNESIADIGIDRVWRDKDVEGLVACPAVILLRIDLYLDGIALGSLFQSLPVVSVRLYLVASTNHLFCTCRQSGYHLVGLAVDLEGQRRDIDGHRDVGIVRIDSRQLISVLVVLWYLVSTAYQHRGYCGK